MSEEKKKRKYKPKAIVLDADDTIFDFCGPLCTVHNRERGTCVTPNDLTTWNWLDLELKDASGNKVTGQELRETFTKYEPHGLYASSPLLRDSYNALECMKDKGYKVFVITARKEEYKLQTELSYTFHNIGKYIDDTFFKPADFPETENFKVKKIKELSKEYNIRVFADDKNTTINQVVENCNVNKVFIINKAHNRSSEFDPEEVTRINDLMEIIRYLRKVN